MAPTPPPTTPTTPTRQPLAPAPAAFHASDVSSALRGPNKALHSFYADPAPARAPASAHMRVHSTNHALPRSSGAQKGASSAQKPSCAEYASAEREPERGAVCLSVMLSVAHSEQLKRSQNDHVLLEEKMPIPPHASAALGTETELRRPSPIKSFAERKAQAQLEKAKERQALEGLDLAKPKASIIVPSRATRDANARRWPDPTRLAIKREAHELETRAPTTSSGSRLPDQLLEYFSPIAAGAHEESRCKGPAHEFFALDEMIPNLPLPFDFLREVLDRAKTRMVRGLTPPALARIASHFDTIQEYQNAHYLPVVEECVEVILAVWKTVSQETEAAMRTQNETLKSHKVKGKKETDKTNKTKKDDEEAVAVEFEYTRRPGRTSLVEYKVPRHRRFCDFQVVTFTTEDMTVIGIICQSSDIKQGKFGQRIEVVYASTIPRDRVATDGMVNSHENLVSIMREFDTLHNIGRMPDHLLPVILRPDQDGHGSNVVIAIGGCSREVPERVWANIKTKLDTYQLAAVIASVVNGRNAVNNIFGPPGAGKTSTSMAIIAAILAADPNARVFLTTHSNHTLDDLVTRVLSGAVHQFDPDLPSADELIVRIGVSSAEMLEPVKKMLLKYRVDELVEKTGMSYRDAKKTILSKARIVACTLITAGAPSNAELLTGFSHCIVDEAGQATELSTLIPFVLGIPSFTLVGDILQLSATLKSLIAVAAGLARSLLERLQKAGINVLMLQYQYRMNTAISDFVRKYIYGGMLYDSESVLARNCPLYNAVYSSSIFGPRVVFNFSDGRETRCSETGSCYNKAEAAFCVRLLGYLLTTFPELRDSGISVGIIAPYSKHVTIIRDELQRLGLPSSVSVDVDTVDSFQGLEKDIIIVSCVRANPSGDIGFVEDQSRMNVALSRAKHVLFVVADVSTFSDYKLWNAFFRGSQMIQVDSNESMKELNQHYDQNRLEAVTNHQARPAKRQRGLVERR